MLREYFVGGGNIKLPIMSVHVQGLSAVSENDVVYNLMCRTTGTILHIIKDSDAGKEFEEWIKNKENWNDGRVERMALGYILPLLSVDDFLTIIDKEKDISWNEGYRNAQYDIRTALGF